MRIYLDSDCLNWENRDGRYSRNHYTGPTWDGSGWSLALWHLSREGFRMRIEIKGLGMAVTCGGVDDDNNLVIL